VAHVGRQGQVRLARGQRAHVDARVVDGVHADAVAQQGAAAAPPRGIDRDDRHRALGPVDQVAAHEFVDQRRLAGAAGPGDAQHRHLRSLRRRLVHGRQQGIALVGMILGQRDQAGQRARIAPRQVRQQRRQVRRRRGFAHREIALPHDLVDHALQSHGAAVVG